MAVHRSSETIGTIAAALARAAAIVPIVSLERCTTILRFEKIEADGA